MAQLSLVLVLGDIHVLVPKVCGQRLSISIQSDLMIRTTDARIRACRECGEGRVEVRSVTISCNAAASAWRCRGGPGMRKGRTYVVVACLLVAVVEPTHDDGGMKRLKVSGTWSR